MEPGAAETVRALYEAVVRGEDASRLATGALRDFLEIDTAATAHIEAAAQEIEFRRLDVLDQTAERATLFIDGGFRLAARYPGGEWAAQSHTTRGLAILDHCGDGWMVVDLPGSGRSLVASLARTEAREQTGDLELAVAYQRGGRVDTCVVVIRNVGSVPLGGELLVGETAYARLPVRLPFSSPHQGQLMPGETRGERYLFRPHGSRRYVVRAEAFEAEGRVHAARVELTLPPMLFRQRLRQLLFWPRLVEAVAVLALIFGALPGATMPPIYPALLFLLVGAVRLAGFTFLVRSGGRGKGVALNGAIGGTEFLGGAAIVLSYSVWSALPVLATVAVYIWQYGFRAKVQWAPAK